MKKKNLRTIAREITLHEGLARSAGGIAQTKEFLALMGIRWRGMDEEEALAEFRCLRARGGLLSQHLHRLQEDCGSLAELEGTLPEED